MLLTPVDELEEQLGGVDFERQISEFVHDRQLRLRAVEELLLQTAAQPGLRQARHQRRRGGQAPYYFRVRSFAADGENRLFSDWSAPADRTAADELAAWLSMHPGSPAPRHLRPMLETGRLEFRYPGRPPPPETGLPGRAARAAAGRLSRTDPGWDQTWRCCSPPPPPGLRPTSAEVTGEPVAVGLAVSERKRGRTLHLQPFALLGLGRAAPPRPTAAPTA